MVTGGNDQQAELLQIWPERGLRANPELVTTRLGEELVIYHLVTDRFYTLNLTGARIWDLLNDGQDPIQIQQQLLREFAIDEMRLGRETAELISSFLSEHLVLSNDG